jgi:uncharacterized membrane protein YdcZ (DUF606 family)
MKKKYEGLVTGLRLAAFLLFIFGVIGSLLVMGSIYGGSGSGVVAFVSVVITTLLLNAVAAGIDLLAGIEVNTRETADLLRQRRGAQPDRVTPLAKRPGP